MIKRALISVYDKSGLGELMEALSEFGVEIVSSGGTARRIRGMGYDVTEVAEYTGHPESPGGLLKTLHPRIHGGILLDPGNPEHRVAARGAGLKEAAENIDIGGPTMTRSAAKATLLHDTMAVVTDPSQYREVVETLRANGGELTPGLRRRLAEKAFERTVEYDAAIVEYLEG
jgi:phosphoribosylaminoimidazolecarboxamide formyltransferase/IMP cyclohydrolase